MANGAVSNRASRNPTARNPTARERPGLLHRLFAEHPAMVGESYAEHARNAGRFGLKLIGAGTACIVHAVIPAFCVSTASRTVTRMHEDMRRRQPIRRDGSDHGIEYHI